MRWQWLVLAFIISCSTKSAAPPVDAGSTPTTPRVADQRGHTIEVVHAPQRIVSLSPALTETLFAVGCGDRIVLRDGWSDFPPAARAIPAIQGFTPSAEAILAAHPDLVLTNFPPPALAQALDAAHVPWLAFSPKHTADVAQAIAAVGHACGQAEKGAQLSTAFTKRIEDIEQRLQGITVPAVFYEMDAGIGGQPYTIGSATFGHEVLTRAQGRNVFGDEAREWFQVSPEAVLGADPDVVLLGDADAQDAPQSLETLRRRPAFALLRAVRTGQVFGLHTDLVARPGPRLALGVEEIARLLHPLALLDLPLFQPL